MTVDSVRHIPQDIYSHVLTGTNPCINQAIHDMFMHDFFFTLPIRVLGRHKIDAIKSNVQRSKNNLVTLG